MATAYHRDQAGAPALVYSTAGNVAAHFTALKGILKACLISGYGSQPAAGWELIAEGAAHLVLRNGSHSGYVCLTWVSGVVRVYLAETFTGMNGDVMMGDGLKTGIAANNSLPHAFAASHFAHSSAVSSWTVIADSKTFLLTIFSSHLTTNFEMTSAPQAHYGLTLYVGEDSNGNYMAVGGMLNGSTNPTGVIGYFGGITGGVAGLTTLKNPATGLLVDTGSIVVATPGFWATTGSTATENAVAPLPVAWLSPAVWLGGGAYGGRLRGVAVVPPLINSGWASYAAQSLGFSGPMTIRQANTPIDLGDGHIYFVRTAHFNAPFFLTTDNPEFW